MAKTEATKASQQLAKQVTKDFAKLAKTHGADMPYLIGFMDGAQCNQFGWTKIPMTISSVAHYTAGWKEAQKAFTKAPVPRKKRSARL